MTGAGGPDRPDPAAEQPPGGAAAGDRVGPEAAAPDPAALAGDWITVWQSELAALAADREVQEGWQALAALWAGVAGAALAALPRAPVERWAGRRTEGFAARADAAGPVDAGPAHERTDRPAGTAAAAGAAAAAAAPEPRDAEIERLHRRIGVLESRLARLEAGDGAGGRGDRRGAPRRRV